MVTRENSPGLIAQIELGLLAQQIHVGLPERGDGSNVLPIALKGICKHLLPCCQHVGDNVLTEVVGRAGSIFVGRQIIVKLFAIEYVNAHACQIGIRILGLFRELIDRAVRVGAHDTKAAGLLHGNCQNGNGAIRTLLLMVCKHFGVIHLVDMVTRKDEHVLRVVAVDEFHILINRVCCALIPVGTLLSLIGRQDLDTAPCAVQIPRQTVTDILVEHERLILRQNANRINSGIDAVGKREIDDAVLTAEGNCGFGCLGGQCVQTRALAACEQHCDTFFFLEHKKPLLRKIMNAPAKPEKYRLSFTALP